MLWLAGQLAVREFRLSSAGDVETGLRLFGKGFRDEPNLTLIAAASISNYASQPKYLDGLSYL